MSILFKLFVKIFSKDIDNFVKEAKSEAVKKEREYRNEQKKGCELTELSMMIGKPVISISNEWSNPVIGFGKRIDFISKAKNPVLIIEDYVSGEDVLVLSTPFYFSEQRFNALAKLDPFEICSIIFRNSAWMTPFDKVKSGVFDGYDVIREKLKATDFYERFEASKIKDVEGEAE